MTDFAVFANDIFQGIWTAADEKEAVQMCAEDVGTEGNTKGMEAVDVNDCDPSWLDN
jgi:hypothetical protein